MTPPGGRALFDLTTVPMAKVRPMHDDQDVPEFAREAVEAGDDVDRRLEEHNDEFDAINRDLNRLREAQRLARGGEYEASNALLDKCSDERGDGS
jgi:hypothetical protein